MLLSHIVGLFKDPESEWKKIRKENCSVGKCYCSHVLLLAVIPPVSFFIGLSQIGWTVGSSPIVEKLTVLIALTYSVLMFVSILVGIFSMGAMVYWMSKTYGEQQALPRCIGLAAYSLTPILLIGIMGIYPILWLNMLAALPALAYSIYLLYTGVPVMMGISKDRGFLFSSAVLAAGLVMLVAMMVATVILWDLGLAPRYAN